MGITDRRLFDGDENLNESARTGFLVGTGPSLTVAPGGRIVDLAMRDDGRR